VDMRLLFSSSIAIADHLSKGDEAADMIFVGGYTDSAAGHNSTNHVAAKSSSKLPAEAASLLQWNASKRPDIPSPVRLYSESLLLFSSI
jgi:hypothetical protein